MSILDRAAAIHVGGAFRSGRHRDNRTLCGYRSLRRYRTLCRAIGHRLRSKIGRGFGQRHYPEEFAAHATAASTAVRIARFRETLLQDLWSDLPALGDVVGILASQQNAPRHAACEFRNPSIAVRPNWTKSSRRFQRSRRKDATERQRMAPRAPNSHKAFLVETATTIIYGRQNAGCGVYGMPGSPDLLSDTSNG